MLGLARRGVGAGDLDEVRPVAGADALREARARGRRDARRATRSPRYVVDVVRRTRELPSVELGASPRAAVHLLGAARAAARLAGRDFVTPDDVAAHGARPSCATGSCSRPRRSSSATAPTTPCAPRSATCRCRGEPDPARGGAPARRGRRSGHCRRRSPSVALIARARAGRRDASPTPSPSRAPAAARAHACRRSSPAVSRAAHASRPPRPAPGAIRVRQPIPPDLALDPREADGGLDARLTPLRRGRHALAAGRRAHRGPARARPLAPRGRATSTRCSSIPTCPRPAGSRSPCARAASASRAALTRGPLGLGTDFESIRDYLPDDDIAPDQLARDGPRRAADEQPVPRRAGPRGHAADRRRPPDGRAARATARGWTPRSTPRPPSRSSPTRSATAAARRLRRRRPPPAAAAPRGRRRGRARAVRPRAAAGRHRLRARLPDRRGRQARADRRVHRPARGGGGAAARRRGARCSRAATSCSSPRSRDPDLDARSPRGPSAPRDVYGQAVALDVLPRAPASPHGLRARRRERGRGARRRPRRRLRARLPQGEGARPALSLDAAPRPRSPQYTTPSPTPTTSAPPRPRSRRARTPRPARRARATASCRARSPSPAAPRAAATAARERPGLDQRPADPQPRRGGDDDARQLEHAVRDDELDEQLAARPVLDRRARRSRR